MEDSGEKILPELQYVASRLKVKVRDHSRKGNKRKSLASNK